MIVNMDFRQRAAGKAQVDGAKKHRTRHRAKPNPAPEANAELQSNIDVCSKSPLKIIIQVFQSTPSQIYL